MNDILLDIKKVFNNKKTFKLKCSWNPNMSQDIMAYHSIEDNKIFSMDDYLYKPHKEWILDH